MNMSTDGENKASKCKYLVSTTDRITTIHLFIDFCPEFSVLGGNRVNILVGG